MHAEKAEKSNEKRDTRCPHGRSTAFHYVPEAKKKGERYNDGRHALTSGVCLRRRKLTEDGGYHNECINCQKDYPQAESAAGRALLNKPILNTCECGRAAASRRRCRWRD